MERMLTLSEAERLTGKTRKTLRAWAMHGKLSTVQDGKRILIPASEMARVFPRVRIPDGPVPLKSSKPTAAPAAAAGPEAAELVGKVRDLEHSLELASLRESGLVRELSLVQAQLAILQEELKASREREAVYMALLPGMAEKRQITFLGRFRAAFHAFTGGTSEKSGN